MVVEDAKLRQPSIISGWSELRPALGEHTLAGIFVVAQTQKYRLAKLPLGGPFLEGDLGHEPRCNVGDVLFARRIYQRRLRLHQRLKLLEERGQDRLRKSCSHFADVVQFPATISTE